MACASCPKRTSWSDFMAGRTQTPAVSPNRGGAGHRVAAAGEPGAVWQSTAEAV